MSDELTRREFLRTGSALIAVGLLAPPWLASIARADMRRMAAGRSAVTDRVLVVCQLSGGNDGLNTVVPFTAKQYYELRPTIGVEEGKLLEMSNDLGLHPALEGLHKLWQRKRLALINGVGYPHPNRSHFRSMEIWQTANPDEMEQYGWLGRYLDAATSAANPNPVVAIGLGTQKEQALVSERASVPTFASLADIQAMVGDPDTDKALRAIQGMDGKSDSGARFVREATTNAFDAMAELQSSLSKYESKAQYANDRFGQGFKQVAHLIAVSPRTRVIYFSAGGFDTHSQQAGQHERLLKQFGDALHTFIGEMEQIGKADNVAVMVFSEFGRRVKENASAGTDHGAAAPMFVVGGAVKGGLYGKHPSLDDLEQGDLKYNTDFRQVYATMLSGWMNADAPAIIGRDFGTLPLF